MKAWEVRELGIDNLTLTERDVPAVGAGEVLVKLHAASLNYRDVMVVEGTYNPRMRLPAVPFSDAAGSIGKMINRKRTVHIGWQERSWKSSSGNMEAIFAEPSMTTYLAEVLI